MKTLMISKIGTRIFSFESFELTNILKYNIMGGRGGASFLQRGGGININRKNYPIERNTTVGM